jgi:nucleoside-diphosphate-sugar epimerase
MLALVTGATGFIGRHLLTPLLENGIRTRAFVRPSSNVRALEAQGIEIVRGDFHNQDILAAAVAGVDVVFHAAGYVTTFSPFTVGEATGRAWAPYQEGNVEFTAALLEASLAARVGRFLYVSSSSVYAPEAPVPTPEDAPLCPLSLYGRSKLLAEEAVRASQERGLLTTIVRPAIAYGPGDRAFTPLALRLARLPFLPLVNGGRHKLDLIYAADVADLLWTVAQRPAAAGRVYNAGPGQPTSLYELASLYRQLAGHGPRITPIPSRLVVGTAPIARLLARPFGPQAAAIFSPQAIALLTLDLHLDMRRAAEELAYHPRHSLKQGLALTLQQSG